MAHDVDEAAGDGGQGGPPIALAEGGRKRDMRPASDRARALPSLCFASRAPLAVVTDERIIQGGAAPGTLGPILGPRFPRLGALLVLIANLEIILGLELRAHVPPP